MNHFTSRQVIVLCALSLSMGALFSPPLQSVAQPESSHTPETPQPLATPEPGSRTTRAIGAITGEGGAGSIAKFTGPNAIGNSVMFENAGKIGIGTTAPAGLLSVKGTAANVYPIFGLGVGTAILGSSSAGIGVQGTHSDASGAAPGMLGETNSTSADSVGVMGRINSASPGASSAGVRGINLGTNGAGFGVLGTHSGTGAGVYGRSAQGTAVLADSSGTTDGYGVRGRHTSTAGAAPGVGGETNSIQASAAGVEGVVISSSPGTAAAGVRGVNNGTNASGYGVYGNHKGRGVGVYGFAPSGRGVYGLSTSNHGVQGQSNKGYGVYGDSLDSFGVWGESRYNAGVGGYSASGNGVYGESNSASGVFGRALSTNAYAGYFVGKARVNGNLQVTGTLSKGAGSFKIDHPIRPATQYLSHSFVESPDMMNVYNGNITTDDKGEAWVKLPSYFQALNRDFRYQLTPIGQFTQTIVGEEIKGNRFLIRTDKPGVKVSWQVTGIRNDAYARQNRIRVEENKIGEDRGKYLYPAGFGFGKDKEIGERSSRLARR